MAAKRKTPPKDFDDVLAFGDLPRIQAVYDECRQDAYDGYGKDTALGMRGYTPELARWLVGQGLDVDTPGTYGTPLAKQASFGDMG